jgi:hypothetical protein
VSEGFDVCPRKHPVGRKTSAGECTPLRCADAEADKARQARRRERVAEETAAAESEETALAKQDAAETKAIRDAAKRHEKWIDFLTDKKGLPKFESLEAAEKWFDSFVTTLLPATALDLARDLKYGNDAQRREARRDLLAATGRSKKEAAATSAPPIVIQVQGGISLPWRSGGQVVEGEVSREDREGLPSGASGTGQSSGGGK